MLRGISDVLRGLLRADDGLYRIGGDEFAALVSGPGIDLVANRWGDHVEALMPGLGRVSASVGAATGRSGDDTHGVVALADTRMYGNKDRRRGHSARRTAADQDRRTDVRLS